MKLLDILVRDLPGLGGWPFGVESMMQCKTSGRFYRCDIFAPGALFSGTQLDIADDRGMLIVYRHQYDAALAEKVNGRWGRWIDWGGGECPITDGNQVIDLKFRDGEVEIGTTKHHWRWMHNGDSGDVIAYRLHKPEEKAGPAEPEWNGEGLPTVGCEFEYGSHRTKAKCLAIAHHMIFASKGDPDDEDGEYEEFMISIADSEFHEVRTEEDKRRDAAKAKIAELCRESASNGHSADLIYDAIAAGIIPGLKLDN